MNLIPIKTVGDMGRLLDGQPDDRRIQYVSHQGRFFIGAQDGQVPTSVSSLLIAKLEEE